MQLECKECHRTLNLPDAKLPVGRPFAFSCPYCKGKNTAQYPGPTAPATPEASEVLTAGPPSAAAGGAASRPPAAPPEPIRATGEAAGEPPAKVSGKPIDLQSALSEVVDDRPKAMVVYDDPTIQKFLIQKLESGGYKAMAALNPRDAAKQLKFANFSLLVLQEDYCGTSIRGNLLLRSLQTLDLASRRGMLVILVSPQMTSLDDLTAFGLSIDGIINIADIDSLDRLLVSVTARATKFYSLYRQALIEHGLD